MYLNPTEPLDDFCSLYAFLPWLPLVLNLVVIWLVIVMPGSSHRTESVQPRKPRYRLLSLPPNRVTPGGITRQSTITRTGLEISVGVGGMAQLRKTA